MNEILSRWFRHHPIAFPLILLLGSLGAFGWYTLFSRTTHIIAFYSLGIMILGMAAGAVLLPIGVVTAIRRHRNVQVLQCPHCQAVSRESTVPFRMEEIDHVDYLHVICSRCRGDFTVDRFARLA